jgi:hypothetical protein
MYFFYIDDSGSRDPNFPEAESGHPGRRDHIYTLTAVGLYEHLWRAVEEELNDYKERLRQRLKTSHGINAGLMDCEVKSTYLRHAKVRRQESPFLDALPPEDLTKLAEMYYSQLAKHRMHLISIVIDKRHLHDGTSSESLHLMAYEMLLERVERLMSERYRKHNALMIMDDSERALNRAVALKHAKLLHRGGRKIYFRHIAEYPFFTESSLSHGIQLADLCAYNVLRAFRHKDFAYPFFARQLCHYYNSGNTDAGKLDGLKIFPPESPLIAWAAEAYAALKPKRNPPSSGGSRKSGARLG